MTAAPSTRPIQIWLNSLILIILSIVFIGGITRLTGSGLSIVNWDPIMGIIPPLTHDDWLVVFGHYQATPQFQQVNHWMTLSDFQWIYFWEYLHRLLARLVGSVFLIPWLYFVAKGTIQKGERLKYGIAFVLGGLQGALGWFMVKSGLVDIPRVSHYRLAAHLLLALIVLSYLFYLRLDLWWQIKQRTNPIQRRPISRGLLLGTLAIGFMLGLQITWGAFTAGLRAGLSYNTFPDMEGTFIPPGFLAIEPAWLNFFENPATVQWTHRMGAWLIVFLIPVVTKRLRPILSSRRHSKILNSLVGTQFLLGVATLLLKVPVVLGVCHQIVGTLTLLSWVALWHQVNCETVRREGYGSSGPRGTRS